MTTLDGRTSSLRAWRYPAPLLALLVMLACAAPAHAQAMKTFKQWTATCTGSNTCSVRTDTVAITDAIPYQIGLILRRGPAPDAAWRISLMFNNTVPADGTPIIVQMEAEQSFRFAPRTGYRITRDRSMVNITDQKQGAELVRGIRAGTNLHVTFLDARQRETGGKLGLAGAAAAMAWVDVQQKRSPAPDRVSAPHERHAGMLWRIAEQPAQSGRGEISWDQVPAALLVQHLAYECEKPDSDILSPLKPERYKLADNVVLFLVPCTLGAYNQVHRLYVDHTDGEPWIEPLFFADFSRSHGWTGTDRLINAQYDPGTGKLSMLTLGRGIGDCGGRAEYRWDDYAFKLLEFRYWHDCDGTHMPENWPVIYSAPE